LVSLLCLCGMSEIIRSVYVDLHTCVHSYRFHLQPRRQQDVIGAELDNVQFCVRPAMCEKFYFFH